MVINLKEHEVCQHGNICGCATDPISHGICRGLDPNRPTKFVCSILDSTGIVKEDVFRSSMDLTGNMQLLQECESEVCSNVSTNTKR